MNMTDVCNSKGWRRNFRRYMRRKNRRRVDIRLGVAVLLILLATLVSHPDVFASAVSAPQSEPTTELSAEARQAALIINRLRIDAGLAPLAVHPLLNLAVTQHINDMVTSGHYGHSGSDGSDVQQRISRTGYAISGWAGENWAVSDTVEESIQWWMADPPHRDNVLGRGYTEMGLGVYPHPKGWGLILVVDFTTGSNNQEGGVVLLPETADAPMPVVELAAPVASGVDGAAYTIRQGDTLSSVGQRYGLSWQAIAHANGMAEFSILTVGETIVLPGVSSVQDEISAPVAAPAPAPLTQPDSSVTVNDQIYTVTPGDTIFAIAGEHGLNWQTLAAYNGLSDNALLQIGDSVRIPAPAVGGDVGVAAPATAIRRHTVQPGETLWSIADAYDVSWFALMEANHLDENSVLSIGQEIRLP